MARRQYRILALDVDGTLLDPGGALRPRTAEAVARAARAGIRPVLCTGRRYRRARPIAAQLALNAPIVCNSGAIVKDPCDDRTLWRLDFDPPLQGELLELFVAHGQPIVAFTDRASMDPDFIVPGFPTGKPLFDEYVARNREHAELDPDWTTNLRQPGGRPSRHPLFHVCAVGTRPEMLAFHR
jgi:hydroxymethylpyrimidine pyrophosphatase-like HAD family hydrolase